MKRVGECAQLAFGSNRGSSLDPPMVCGPRGNGVFPWGRSPALLSSMKSPLSSSRSVLARQGLLFLNNVLFYYFHFSAIAIIKYYIRFKSLRQRLGIYIT